MRFERFDMLETFDLKNIYFIGSLYITDIRTNSILQLNLRFDKNSTSESGSVRLCSSSIVKIGANSIDRSKVQISGGPGLFYSVASYVVSINRFPHFYTQSLP